MGFGNGWKGMSRFLCECKYLPIGRTRLELNDHSFIEISLFQCAKCRQIILERPTLETLPENKMDF